MALALRQLNPIHKKEPQSVFSFFFFFFFLLEDQEKSGKFDIFWKKSGKSRRTKFLSMQIFNFYKSHIHAEMCAVELYMTISCAYDCYYLNLVLR